MKSFEDIEVVPGKNGDSLMQIILKRNSSQFVDAAHPHGFYPTYKPAEVAQLCTIFREEFLTMLRSMPKSLAERTVERNNKLEIYGVHAPGTSALMSLVSSLHNLYQKKGDLRDVDGIFINTAKVAPRFVMAGSPDVVLSARHELAHLIISDGVDVAHSVNESFARRIDFEFGHQFKVNQKDNVDPNNIVGTSGLRFPDYVHPPLNCTMYNHSVSSAAIHSLRRQSIDEVWNITCQLLQDADRDQRIPPYEHVSEVIRNELKDKADDVLSSPTFMPLESGSHQFVFPLKDKGGALIFSFDAASQDGKFNLQNHPIAEMPMNIVTKNRGTVSGNIQGKPKGVSVDFGDIAQSAVQSRSVRGPKEVKEILLDSGSYKLSLKKHRTKVWSKR